MDAGRTAEEFLGVVKRWILDSPHSKITEGDLADCTTGDSFSCSRGTHAFEAISNITASAQMVATKMSQADQEVEWSTEAVFSRVSGDAWVGVRTSRESNSPAVRLPPAKKPLLIRALLNKLSGGLDGRLQVLDTSHRLGNNDIEMAAELMLGRAGCHLPMVYVSTGFAGQLLVDSDWLAKALSGMAHVVVEPNRSFSRRLQIEVSSQNVYGGAVGIYWPEAAGRRSFFVESAGGREELVQAITDEVEQRFSTGGPFSE